METKSNKTQAAARHRPQGDVDLDTVFPEALALLRHMGIKETGSGVFSEGKVR